MLQFLSKILFQLYVFLTQSFRSYQFKLEEVEAFRYRAKDAWRAVTRIAVREARLKEIKQEIFNCQKLKSYFEDNPTDLQVLRHDKALHTVRIQQHLSDVPEYIIPPTLKGITNLSRKKRKRDNYRTSQASSSRFQVLNKFLSNCFLLVCLRRRRVILY